MLQINLKPLAFVKNSRTAATDDFWGQIVSEIRVADDIPTDAFEGISTFSHLEIIYCFDKVKPEDAVFSGHPRGNKNYPNTGIFAQRKKDRPNRLGLCRVQLLEHRGRSIFVTHLDAIDGTPVLDIKPVFKEFEQQGPITQPAWVADLMKDYWK